MHKTPIWALLLLLLAQPVPAQLPGGGALENLPAAKHEDIENRIERNRERAQSRAEQAVNSLVDKVPAATPENLVKQPVDPETRRYSTPVKELEGHLTDLLPSLAILNANGQTVLTEVQLANGWRAVEREWLLVVNRDKLQALQNSSIELLEESRLQQLGLVIVRMRVSPELDSGEALLELLGTETITQLDRNHIYEPQAGAASLSAVNMHRSIVRKTSAAVADAAAPICSDPLSLGIIDTAVTENHPAFSKVEIKQRSFVPAGVVQPQAHGTAVAGVLVGTADKLLPLLGNAKLFVASAFYPRDANAPGATMMNLVNALGWLAEQQVRVINMSLAGPQNYVLQRVIASLAANDIAMVAAVGNQGPASPPLYPAAYPGVIGVTAVDSNQRIYRWANRGEQVEFSAPGVMVPTVLSTGGVGHETGTSMAAPVVSAYMACALHDKKHSTGSALAQLRGRVIDLGEQGRDNTFGHGLLAR